MTLALPGDRFHCRPLQPTSSLRDFGIWTERPHGTIAHRIVDGKLLAEIGKLIAISGIIHAVPKSGLSARQHAQLLGAASNALFSERTESGGWKHARIAGVDRWTSWVSVPAEEVTAQSLASMSTHWDLPASLTG